MSKTVVATGASSGLGFEAVRQLVIPGTHSVILGARKPTAAREAFANALQADAPDVTVLALELANLKSVQDFAKKLLDHLGQRPIDVLLLAAAITDPAHGSKTESRWCETYIVNHLSQHYLVHLLREKLVASRTRVVFVSSGSIRTVNDTSTLEKDLRVDSDITAGFTTYGQAKFVQLLGAHWWRRQLRGSCDVVAVSPGLVPGTGIGRGAGWKLSASMDDAISVPQGATNIIRAITKSDFPENPDLIFLTSWGEWWEVEKSIDKDLQDKWCPSRAEIEREEGLA